MSPATDLDLMGRVPNIPCHAGLHPHLVRDLSRGGPNRTRMVRQSLNFRAQWKCLIAKVGTAVEPDGPIKAKGFQA